MLTSLLTLGAAKPEQHAYNHPTLVIDGWWVWSGHQSNLVISGVIVIGMLMYAASRIKTGDARMGAERYVARGRFPHLIEVLCVYLRDEVARPLLHDRTDRLMPFLWTLFFFILVNNLLGLVPLIDLQHLISKEMKSSGHVLLGGTATQNLFTTGVLATMAMLVFNGAAIKRLGWSGYFQHMTGGAPAMVAPLVFVLELAGQVLIKPVALALRLFANMTAGHILLAVLASFVGTALTKGVLIAAPVTVLAVAGSIAVMFLELFVAFLQAFVFFFLVTVFISLMDHHDEHGHEHGHDHAHGHEHAHA